MNRFTKFVGAVAVGAVLSASQAQASVALDVYLDGLLPAVPGTAVMFVDSAGDGFGDLTFAADPILSESMWSPDDDDVAVVMPMNTSGWFEGSAVFYLTGLVNSGDQLLFAFYPGLVYAPGLAGPGQGQAFGTYRDDLGGYYGGLADGYAGFVLPFDGFGGNLVRVSGDTVGYPTQLFANQTTAIVPEPSTVVLVGLSALAIAGGLRRRK